LEQAEWFGLHPWEAVKKQEKIEAEKAKSEIRPWKENFTRQLSAYLEKLKAEGKSIPKAENKEEYILNFLKISSLKIFYF
jgi:DNA replication initiation complex subunit (GINS family)